MAAGVRHGPGRYRLQNVGSHTVAEQQDRDLGD